jgi:hypothetical protein
MAENDARSASQMIQERTNPLMSQIAQEDPKPKKKDKKKKLKPIDKAKLVAAGIVIGAVLGVAGVNFFQNYNPTDTQDSAQIVAASVVFERIQNQNELVCASQQYNITEKVEKSDTILFTSIINPLTVNSFWYRYVGTIKVAVNLETAKFSTAGNTITITLDAPYISSNTPDMDRSGVLEDNNTNLFNRFSVDEIDDFKAKCIEAGEAQALEGGIMDDARVNAEENLAAMFNAALGDDYTVEFVWREE